MVYSEMMMHKMLISRTGSAAGTRRRFWLLGSIALAGVTLAACDQGESAPASIAGADSGAAAAGAATVPTDLVVLDGAPEGGWGSIREKTAAGGFAMGNPDAPIQLIEYASLTCPVCATFNAEASKPLKEGYVASGQVRFELRNFAVNAPDITAAMLTRCETPARFFALTDMFMKRQRDWIGLYQSIDEAEAQKLASAAPEAQLLGLAQLAGLDDWVKAMGIPPSRFAGCITSAAADELARLRQIGQQEGEVEGTPSFTINGEKISAFTWSGVKSALDTQVQR